MDQFLGLHQLVLVVLVHAGLAVLQVEHGVPLPELDLIPLLQPRELLPHEGVIEWVPVGGEEELLDEQQRCLDVRETVEQFKMAHHLIKTRMNGLTRFPLSQSYTL